MALLHPFMIRAAAAAVPVVLAAMESQRTAALVALAASGFKAQLLERRLITRVAVAVVALAQPLVVLAAAAMDQLPEPEFPAKQTLAAAVVVFWAALLQQRKTHLRPTPTPFQATQPQHLADWKRLRQTNRQPPLHPGQITLLQVQVVTPVF